MTPHPVDMEALEKRIKLHWSANGDDVLALIAEMRAARQAIAGLKDLLRRAMPGKTGGQGEGEPDRCRACLSYAHKGPHTPDCWVPIADAALASPSVPPPQTSPIVGLPPSPLSETERYARDASSKPSDAPATPAQDAGEETAALKEGAEVVGGRVLNRVDPGFGSDAAGNAGVEGAGAPQTVVALDVENVGGRGSPGSRDQDPAAEDAFSRGRPRPAGPQGSDAGNVAEPQNRNGARPVPAPRPPLSPVSQQPGMAPACPECGPLVTPEELRKLLDNAVPGVEELGRSLKKVFRLPDEDLILDAGAATSDPCGAPPSAPALPKEEVAPGLPCVHGRRGLCPHCFLAPAPLPEEQLPKDGTCETHQGLHERTAACVRWWPHAQPSGPAAAPAPGDADMKAARLLLGTGCVHEPDPATKAECVKCIAAEMARVRSDERERWMAQARGLQTVAGKCAPTAIVIPLGWLIRASDATSAGGGE